MMPAEKRESLGEGGGERKRKRKSRWGETESEKTFIPGMPTSLPADASQEQQEQYLLQLQIEDTTRSLRSGELGIPLRAENRSPSPEPIYNNEGKRLNTREYRTRKKLEETRHDCVRRLLEINPSFKPPPDYKPPTIRVNDRVVIPQDEHPELNFVGLLIGPRGNTLKNLEKETGAKIIIRGKGSVKEGKIGRKDGQPMPGEDEPLHAYITANDPINVQKAVTKIKEIIRQGVEVPESQNDLRKNQLKLLAQLNGTYRDENEGLNKLRQRAEAQTIITNTILCSVCGGAGHIAKDCMQSRPGVSLNAQVAAGAVPPPQQPSQPLGPPASQEKMDSEYHSLMAELGERPPPPVPNMDSRGHGLGGARPLMLQGGPPPTGPPPPNPGLSNSYGYGSARRGQFGNMSQGNMSQPPPRAQPPSLMRTSMPVANSPWQSNPQSQNALPPPVMMAAAATAALAAVVNHRFPPPNTTTGGTGLTSAAHPPGRPPVTSLFTSAPPPPPHLLHARPPHMTAAAPPPPPSTGSYSLTNAPPAWSAAPQQSAPLIPAWPQGGASLPPPPPPSHHHHTPTSFGAAAPPPPPPSHPTPGGYGGYQQYGAPPPPPPPSTR